MFALIVALIAILLAIGLTGAMIYYGGDAATSAGSKAAAATYRNEAAQIAGAITAYRAEGNSVTAEFKLTDLVPNYLKQLPQIGWNINSNRIYIDGINENVCVAANDSAGFTYNKGDSGTITSESGRGIPICTDDLNATVPCCMFQN
ncbi:hypothetical protein RYA05_05115 [Pseudomonas syringae pv. actinidiae]|nr:hypothetical protein [Pseudomonas syringae pv. actinidiae]